MDYYGVLACICWAISCGIIAGYLLARLGMRKWAIGWVIVATWAAAFAMAVGS